MPNNKYSVETDEDFGLHWLVQSEYGMIAGPYDIRGTPLREIRRIQERCRHPDAPPEEGHCPDCGQDMVQSRSYRWLR